MTTTAVLPPSTDRTRALLIAGLTAGPLWAVVSLAQAATRDGFAITRHPLSALSNGDLGWLQIANFLVAGVLTLLGAGGLRRRLSSVWVPRLVTAVGIGLIGAGVCVMDPVDGFPVGTPAGPPVTLSWHSYGHMFFGTIAFSCLIAVCYLLGRHFRRAGEPALAATSRAAGTALLV